MKLYTFLPNTLKPYFNEELNNYRTEFLKGNLNSAWNHLEKAHILGQIYRLIFGGVKSFVGKVPVGNPGGANVPPLKPFPIDQDLQNIFIKSGLA